MRLIMFFGFIIISSSIFAQTSIEGLGRFKLKKTTTAYLDTVAREQKLDRVIFRNFQDQMKDRHEKLAEIIADTLDFYRSPTRARFCKDARVFYVSKMTISSIAILDTYLTFYRDTLVDISTEYTSDIFQALELKYGKGEFEQKDKTVTCTITFTGQKVEHTETMFYSKWQNGDINCTAAIGDYYDSECKKQSLSYVSITIFKALEKMRACDEEIKNNIKNRKDASKKKSLKDFLTYFTLLCPSTQYAHNTNSHCR